MADKKKIGIVGEFKEFIAKGNVFDMAVGIIIGSAFTAVVKSLVDQVLMPAIGVLIGGMDFSQYKIVLAAATEETAESAIYYGSFIQTIVNFLLIALTVFLLIRSINGIKRRYEKKADEAPAVPETPSADIVLLTEIRDLLKKTD